MSTISKRTTVSMIVMRRFIEGFLLTVASAMVIASGQSVQEGKARSPRSPAQEGCSPLLHRLGEHRGGQPRSSRSPAQEWCSPVSHRLGEQRGGQPRSPRSPAQEGCFPVSHRLGEQRGGQPSPLVLFLLAFPAAGRKRESNRVW